MMALNHGFSGYVCGQVAMPWLRRRAPVSEAALSWAFFLGAMMPDGDILSRVFLGRWAFFATEWYGHRAASHSILGTLILALLLGVPLTLLALRGGGGTSLEAPGTVSRTERWAPHRRAYPWLVGCLWAGGLLHIVGDFATPGRPMPVLWPLDERYGALSHIGWFTPYLLWLFLTTIALGWLGSWGLPRIATLRPWREHLVWGLYALASYRWLQFITVSRYENRGQWAVYQDSLLPEALIVPVTRGVSAAWFWMTR